MTRPGGSPALRLGFAVNAPGIQERRAEALATVLADHVADVLVAPTPADVYRQARAWDVAYVIDPGRRGFPAALAAKAAGATVLVEVGDPQASLYKAQDRSAAEQMLGAVLDRLVSVGADGIVVRGRELAQILGVRRPWVFIPDGVDLERFRPVDGTPTRRELGIPETALVCGVVGSITWSERAQFAYGLDIVEAAARDTTGAVHALIVGDGTGVDVLRSRAAMLGVSRRVHLVGRVAHDRVPQYLSAMDVCVSTQTTDDVGRSRTTAKLPEYVACDRWVLASRVGGAADILPPHMLMTADVAHWDAYVAELASRLTELGSRLEHVRDHADTRTLAEREFSYEVLAQRALAFAHHCTRGD